MVGVVLSAHHLVHNTLANMAAIQINDIFQSYSFVLRAIVVTCMIAK